MSVQLNPYLMFRNEARPAMQFYQTVFGGSLEMNTFGESHASDDPAEADKIMHAQLNGENAVVFMASDTPNGVERTAGSSISMSLSGDDEALLRGYFEKLSDGGRINMPLEKAPWGDTFGACTDKFGIDWMVNISGAPAGPQA